MKVFVTGASGFVGEKVLRQLHEAGHSIRILARNPQSARATEIAARFGAEIHPGNVLDATTLSSGLSGMEAVIHLVGIISEVAANTFENAHVRGTQNISNAARQAGVKRFVHMSALGTRPNARSRYHQSKWAAEEIVRQSGMDYTIFRPSIIYGPGDKFVNLFAKVARFSPFIPIMGDGCPKMQPIPVADVATCFVGAFGGPKSIGQTYDLCGPEAMSFNEIIDAILHAIGRRRRKLHLPMGIARLQAGMLEFVFPMFGKAPPLNRDQLLMLEEDNVGNPLPAAQLFGLKLTPFKDGIGDYLTRR